MDARLRKYLSSIGQRGGRKSRRRLSPEVARQMVRIREARRAYRRFHTQCFWSYDPQYRVTEMDIPWIAEQLMKHGGREAWEVAARLRR